MKDRSTKKLSRLAPPALHDATNRTEGTISFWSELHIHTTLFHIIRRKTGLRPEPLPGKFPLQVLPYYCNANQSLLRTRTTRQDLSPGMQLAVDRGRRASATPTSAKPIVLSSIDCRRCPHDCFPNCFLWGRKDQGRMRV